MFQKLKLKTKLRNSRNWVDSRKQTLLLIGPFGVIVSFMLLYHLSTLPTAGLSANEHLLAIAPIGWHGLIQNPLFLINKLLLSIGYSLFGQGGALTTRLPSVMLGALAIICVAVLIRAWHGTRLAVLGCLLFACSAWTLHVSRYASWDSAYLAALPVLLVSQLALYRAKARLVPYLVLLVWSLLIFTPGLIWFIVLAAWWEKDRFVSTWREQKKWWQRALLVSAGLIWSPLLIQFFVRDPGQIIQWLGAPAHFTNLSDFLQRLAAVPLHLFVRGPAIPELWLGQLPLLDIFTLVVTIIGSVFYIRHWRSSRTKLLLGYALIGTVLVALDGKISLSLVVPLVYLLTAAGLSGLLREWTQRFPLNPVVRWAGFTALGLVVLASCVYNLQSYFVAWPHNTVTISHFGFRP